MKISYAITVCNEFVEIQKLLPFLLKNKRVEDEIVILYDESKGEESIEEFLRAKSVNGAFSWHKDKFDGHFGDWKNKLTQEEKAFLTNITQEGASGACHGLGFQPSTFGIRILFTHNAWRPDPTKQHAEKQNHPRQLCPSTEIGGLAATGLATVGGLTMAASCHLKLVATAVVLPGI